MLEDRAGGDVAALAQAADTLVAAASKRPELANVISTFRPHVPAYTVNVDTSKLQTLGVPVTDAYNTLQTFVGGLYVNDFNVFGRTWQVVVQAEPEFRANPTDINRFYVRGNDGNMVPLGTLASVEATTGPDVIYRYNRFRAVNLLGGPAPGHSSGDAVTAMEEVAKGLPGGFGYEWTGTTYQQKLAQGSEFAIFGFAAVLVFLFLAALYESWSIPFAVVLSVPLGIFGALAAVSLRSYPYDIYTQIGIVTLIGLAAKNAILIVEFAKESYEHGKSIRDAALEAAQLRLRPILMTSFAFILGVLPLVIASGASSGVAACAGHGGVRRHDRGDAAGDFHCAGFVSGHRVGEGASNRAGSCPGAGGRIMKYAIVAAARCCLSGCAVGPNYKRPNVAVPDQFRGAVLPKQPASRPSPTPSGSIFFGDPNLRKLADTALQQNFDLKIAAERVQEARAQLDIQRASLFPFLNGQAQFGPTEVPRSAPIGFFRQART